MKLTNRLAVKQASGKDIRVLYVCYKFFPHKGGAEANILSLAKEMTKKGYDVSVLTSQISKTDKDYEVFQGIKIYRFSNLIFTPMYLWFSPKLFWRMIQSNANYMHISGIGFPALEIALWIRKALRKKTFYINTPHGEFMAKQKKDFSLLGFFKIFYTFLLKLQLNFLYNIFISIVEKQKIWLKSEYAIPNEKVFYVPNSIPTETIENYLPTFQKNDLVKIVFTGRMQYYKGVQNVLKALSALKEQNISNWEFTAMGKKDNYANTLLNLSSELNINKNVNFIFDPSDSQISNENLASQISILPSLREGAGIVLLEGMAKGHAVITTFQNDAVDMFIKEGISGFAYDFYDIPRLTEILKKLITDYELRQKIRKHNLSFVKNFTIDKSLEKYQELFKANFKD